MKDFNHWMKKNLSISPSSAVDEKIMAMASREFGSSQASSILSLWLRPGLAVAFTIALVIVVNVNYNRKNEAAKLVITEPQEMLLHYNDIELMADAGALSEADWKKIEGLK